MNFLDFAARLQIDVDEDLVGLVDRVNFACKQFDVKRRDSCVRAFVALAQWARQSTFGREDLGLAHQERLKEVRDVAAKLNGLLSTFDDDEWAQLSLHNASAIDIQQGFASAISCAAQSLAGHRTKRDVLSHVSKLFVLLCMEHGIVIKWSKDLENSAEYCSAKLLAAVFLAGRLPFNGDRESRTAADSANYYLGMLKRGFEWEFDHEYYDTQTARVYLNKIVFDSDVGILPRFRP